MSAATTSSAKKIVDHSIPHVIPLKMLSRVMNTSDVYYSPKFGPLVKSKKVIKLTNKTRIYGDGKQKKI